jgi:tetratricopeptide (TPR) repeat protein
VSASAAKRSAKRQGEAGRLRNCKATSVPYPGAVTTAGKPLICKPLLILHPVSCVVLSAIRRKTRLASCAPALLTTVLILVGSVPAAAQQREADEAWSEGRYEVARRGYEQVLKQNPNSAEANLRLGILVSWDGKLDSALVLIARARAASPTDVEAALTHARVRSWNKQHKAALATYDSVLSRVPALRDAQLGRAQTLSWAGRLQEADSIYRRLIRKNSSDREARLGQAQVSAWGGKLQAAEEGYRTILAQHPRDIEATTGLAYVHYWRGNVAESRRLLATALAVDSTHRSARELRHSIDYATRPADELTAAWSNDSDRNTSFWQTLGATVPAGDHLTVTGSLNALETSDPLRDGRRFGAEGGLSVTLGAITLSGAGGARRIIPELAPSRTSATYGGRLALRPARLIGFHLGYSRMPFDEIAALMERALDMEVFEAGFDVRPFRGFSLYGSGSRLWLSDDNSRSGVAAGISQKLGRRLSVGIFGRRLSYERSGIGYFSPDRFSVLEGTAAYSVETRTWGGSLGGGLGAQQVGRDGTAQTEWHIDGRVGRGWGLGNRVELFGLITNSAVSSTTGAFRYRSAGVNVRLGL